VAGTSTVAYSSHTDEREREPDVPPQDFMPDAVPVATLPIYPGLGPAHKLCWIAHSGAWFVPVN